MITLLRDLGRTGIGAFESLGRSALLFLYTWRGMGEVMMRPRLLLQQVYATGVLSLVIIAVSGLFVGMVLGLQGYNTLVDFGAEEQLGVIVALSLVRELGPVVSALLFAGRAGSALTAEIGLMKATEQLAAMEMMAVDPLHRVVAPRLLGGIIAVPLLASIFNTVGIWGGWFVGVGLLGVDDGSYWSHIETDVSLRDDVANGLIKSLVFGVVVTWIAVFEGYDTIPTSEGISRATTRTVVNASLAILAFDFLLTALMFD
jgi:phospholipid/cholesterol/gamma-HCH transport system permease protein